MSRNTSVAAQAYNEWGDLPLQSGSYRVAGKGAESRTNAEALANLASVIGDTANDVPATAKERSVPPAPESGTRLVSPASNPQIEELQRLMDGIFLRADLVMGLRKKIEAMRTTDPTLELETLLHAPQYKGLRFEVHQALDQESLKIQGVVRGMIRDAFMTHEEVHAQRVEPHNEAADDFYAGLNPADLKELLKT